MNDALRYLHGGASNELHLDVVRSDHLNCDLLLAEAFNLFQTLQERFVTKISWNYVPGSRGCLGSAGCSWSVGPTMSWQTGAQSFSLGYPSAICENCSIIR